MNGKIIIKKPNICVCVIKIDGNITQLGAFGNQQIVEIPIGKHNINVGIEYSDTGHIGMDHGHAHWEDIEWAWKKDKDIIIDETIITIILKRKWHLLKHITAKATINKGDKKYE